MTYRLSEEEYMTNYIKDQLISQYGYTDVEGKSKKELTAVLARFRAMEIDVNAPENNWW